MKTSTAVTLLAALAQTSRLTIFRTLVQAGESGLPAGKISDMTGISPSSLSFHLKELTHASLTKVRHEGRFAIYTADFTAMRELLIFLTDNCCNGYDCDISPLTQNIQQDSSPTQ